MPKKCSIKTCPCCNSIHIELKGHLDTVPIVYFIKCEECGTKSGYKLYVMEAIKDWNRRELCTAEVTVTVDDKYLRKSDLSVVEEYKKTDLH